VDGRGLPWPLASPALTNVVAGHARVLFRDRKVRRYRDLRLNSHRLEPPLATSPLQTLVRKLESVTPLAPQEEQAILALPATVRDIRADQDVVRDGDRPSQSCLIVAGFLCRYKDLPTGTRQIHSIHVAGDMPDLQSLHLQVMDHGLATMTPSKVAMIPHDALRQLTRAHPRVGDALWRDTLVDAAIFREWIVNVGAREAYHRIAHLICEMFLKLRAVGLAESNTFELPLTQGEVAEATGLSTVHVNRSVMQLRANALITWEKGLCTIENWEGLKQAAMFDPTYLHLRGVSEAA
jgi:CRP-like cAMP-binding protein